MPARQPILASQVLYELLAAQRLPEAAEAVDRHARGRRLADVIVTLLEPVVYRIGADVALDVLGPEVEIAAVAVARDALERLAGRGPWKTLTGRRAVTALPPGEEHDLGLEAVAALLAREGWDVSRGARRESADAIVARAVAAAPDVVCLSITTPEVLGSAAALVQDLHAALPGVRVMVGGLAIRLVPERAVRLGADLFAEDARAAVETVRATFSG